VLSDARNFARGPRVRLAIGLLAQASKNPMHEIIYLIGLVVVVMFILGLLGVR
jgi:hypothetical protein